MQGQGEARGKERIRREGGGREEQQLRSAALLGPPPPPVTTFGDTPATTLQAQVSVTAMTCLCL